MTTVPTPHRLPSWERALAEPLSESKWTIRCYDTVETTMDNARALLTEITPERPGLVLAQTQTLGRGRHGKRWDSTKGSLASTFVFQTELPLAAMAGYSLAVGCSISRVLQSLGCALLLKWPNDIYLSRTAKAGGVLIELQRHEGKSYVLTGIGLNLVELSREFPGTGALFSLTGGQQPGPCEVAALLASELLRDWETFQEQGFEPFRQEWLNQALFCGETISVQTGERIISGEFCDINAAGGMVIRSEGEEFEVHSGQIQMPH